MKWDHTLALTIDLCLPPDVILGPVEQQAAQLDLLVFWYFITEIIFR